MVKESVEEIIDRVIELQMPESMHAEEYERLIRDMPGRLEVIHGYIVDCRLGSWFLLL